MAVDCPVCSVILEEVVAPSRALPCSECSGNKELIGHYQWYTMVYEIQRMSFFFTWVWPVVLVVSLFVTRHNVGAVISWSLAMTLWAFNVFWLYPYKGLGWKWWERSPRMEEIRASMFVLKVKGEP